MVTGRVLRFDSTRGYGFVTQEGGGDDVFIHVNDLKFDKTLVSPGALLRFSVEDSGRGLKASTVELLEPGPPSAERAAPARTESTVADETLCDVLSAKEFIEEITECLLTSAPTITGAEITQIRQHLVQIAHTHGWIDG